MGTTPVEWLEKELKAIRLDVDKNVLKFIDKSFEIAKEIEKKQLRECYHFAQIEQQKEFSSIYVGMSFEKWYEQNYD